MSRAYDRGHPEYGYGVEYDDYAKCRVCGCSVRKSFAAAHIKLHRDAGHLVLEAHNQEQRELRDEENIDDV